MNLESQVCSLELAKRLKELGATQESLFYWNYDDAGTKPRITFGHWIHTKQMDSPNWRECSAFSVAEIWGKLPHRLEADNLTSFLVMKRVKQTDGTTRTVLNYEMISGTIHPWCQNEESLAEACAKMLIYLIENGLVKP